MLQMFSDSLKIIHHNSNLISQTSAQLLFVPAVGKQKEKKVPIVHALTC